MAMTAPISERDWTEPATKGDLLLLQASLEGKIQNGQADLESKIKDVEGKIKDVWVGMAKMDRSHSEDMARMRVSIAVMTIGIITVLGGLITLLQFLS